MERTADLAESFLLATENAAIAAAKWRGRGRRKLADGAAVEAMRAVFDDVPFNGRVAIGEGERDDAPMLWIGEPLGSRQGDPNALSIGSDQVAVVGDQQLHKPGCVNSAVEQLEMISGRTVDFYTGVSLWNTATDRCQTKVVQYKATLRDLNRHEIEAYVAADSPLDCAGAFKWERLGISLMQALEGADPTALEGLPLIALCNMLRNEGLALP